MVQLIRSGKRLTGLNILLTLAFILLVASSLPAQTPILCSTSSTPQVVRAEGLTEPVGSLLLNCNGGVAGQTITTNLTVTFPAAITNRINSSGTPDIVTTLDTGAGAAAIPTLPTLSLPNIVSFNGLSVTLSSSRAFVINVSNVRLAAAQLSPNSPVVASFSSSAFSFNSSTATVATLTTGLLANSATTSITCVGSPIPTTLSVQNFFSAGTSFSSIRITEGFGNAFLPKDARSDTGTRIVVRYSNFPATARVFLPDYVAGNSATQPTAGGDLGGTQSGGTYTRTGGGTLLLARVVGPDANGAGGSLVGVASQFVGATPLGTVSEVPLTSGAGIAVYEVIDAGPFVIESAQFPTFVVLPASGTQTVTTATGTVSIGPVSTVATATGADPIPRFRQSTPPNDCSSLNDCSANYFPVLSVGSAPNPITFQSPSQGLQQTSYVQVNNTNAATSSPLVYSATVTYQSGSGYVFIDPPQDVYVGNSTLRVILNAAGLTPGTYQASLIISAGAAGSRTIPITLTVTAPALPVVSVSSVTNAATFTAGPLVAGSLGTIIGTNLAGTNVAVTFDGIAAPVTFKNATQINFQVPAALAAKTTSQLVVTVDGNASTAQAVPLAAAAPGIFGVLNQTGAVNASATPAAPGSVIQIFATGLATNAFTVTAAVNGFPGLVPLYAGDAPGIPGVQQINVTIPATITTGQLQLQICSTNLTLNACSPPFALTVR